jgi:hypothetical protein
MNEKVLLKKPTVSVETKIEEPVVEEAIEDTIDTVEVEESGVEVISPDDSFESEPFDASESIVEKLTIEEDDIQDASVDSPMEGGVVIPEKGDGIPDVLMPSTNVNSGVSSDKDYELYGFVIARGDVGEAIIRSYDTEDEAKSAINKNRFIEVIDGESKSFQIISGTPGISIGDRELAMYHNKVWE